METIHILHTNDIHSHLNNWVYIEKFLISKKKYYQKNGEDVFIFDDGDLLDLYHPLSEATLGKFNVALMNNVGYDAATIGNDEGIGLNHEDLMHLYENANFPIILDNLYDQKTKKIPNFVKPYKIFKTTLNTRICVIGMTAPYPMSYLPNGWIIKNIDQTLPSVLKEIKNKYDILIMLSHLGIDSDKYIAKHYSNIKVIIGGHTHHLLKDGEFINKTLLTAAGKYGNYVGDITIDISENHTIFQMTSTTYSIEQIKEYCNQNSSLRMIDFKKKSDDFKLKGEEILSKIKIAKLPFELNNDNNGKHSMLELALKSLQYYGQTDASILNSGLFLTPLHKGIVTQKDLHMQMPHSLHIINVKLRGLDLWRLVMEIEKNRIFLRRYILSGMGFRGKYFGDVVYNGISVNMSKKIVYWHNSPIDISETYEITTLDMFAFLPYFPTIMIMGKVKVISSDFLRNVIGKYLALKYPL